MPDQKPTLGRIVHYTLTADDAMVINSRRMAQPDAAKGNHVRAGQIFPAMVVARFGSDSDDTANLQVFLDGYDQWWVTSVHEATEDDQHGAYAWPTRS